MGFLKDISEKIDEKLFHDKDGKRMPTYITGNRFNAGMGVKMPKMKLKEDRPVVNKNETKSAKETVSNESEVKVSNTERNVKPRSSIQDTIDDSIRVTESNSKLSKGDTIELEDDKLSLRDED